MRYVKYAAYALAAVIVLIAVAIGIIAATFDPNSYKPQIVQLVKDKTGRTLTIDGDIKLKIFPKIGAQVGKVALSERGSDKEFARPEGGPGVPGAAAAAVEAGGGGRGARRRLARQPGEVQGRDHQLRRSRLVEGAAPEEPKPRSRKPRPAQLRSSRLSWTSAVSASPMRSVTWKDETNGNDLGVELARTQDRPYRRETHADQDRAHGGRQGRQTEGRSAREAHRHADVRPAEQQLQLQGSGCEGDRQCAGLQRNRLATLKADTEAERVP